MNWSFISVLAFFLAFIGGCGGSASGGIKIFRLVSLGVILGGIYQEKYPALENKKEINSVKFQDGTKFTYDKEKHHLEIEVVDKITLKAGGSSIEMTKSGIKLKADKINLN